MAERAIVLIDGEHDPGGVRDALDDLAASQEVAAVLFCGGEEKVGPAKLANADLHYGRQVTIAGPDLPASLAAAIAQSGADIVIDLADEPIVDASMKMRLASVAVHHGLSFRGPGFDLRPQSYDPPPFDAPSVAVIGTGKRCGKTAVGAHWARLMADAGMRPVVVSMGRGGPGEPQLAEAGAGLTRLLEIARAGEHAASDYLEDAALANVPTVGCRRVGGGLAGEVGHTTVHRAAEMAGGLDPGIVIFEGSGATIPPVEVDRTLCVAAGRQAALEHAGPVRLMRADLVIQMSADEELSREIAAIAQAPVIRCELAPEPVEPIDPGARIAFFATSEAARLDRDVAFFSPNLSRRSALERDLDQAAGLDCDVYAIEIKAAAIDTVAERAEREGIRVVFVSNRPRALEGEPDIDAELLELARGAAAVGVSR